MTNDPETSEAVHAGCLVLQPPLQGEWIVLPTPGHPPYVVSGAIARGL